jgi:hypothetical protein
MWRYWEIRNAENKDYSYKKGKCNLHGDWESRYAKASVSNYAKEK